MVLQHLALAELDAGPDTLRQWPAARDRALQQLQAEALAGDQRAARTLAALVQASFDVEYVGIVGQLDEEPGAHG